VHCLYTGAGYLDRPGGTMPYSMKELFKQPSPDKPKFLAWNGSQGIYYRLAPDGSGSWYWRGTLRVGDKAIPRRRVLGPKGEWTAQALEDEAKRLRDLCRAGIDPDAQALNAQVETPNVQAPDSPTCESLWTIYVNQKLERKEISQDTYQDYCYKWGLYVRPTLGAMGVGSVTPADIAAMFDGYGSKVQTMHHIHRILKPFFQWCRRRDRDKKVDPDLFDHKLPKVKPAQDRLMEEEIRRFGKALRECNYVQKWNIRFLLLTGSRNAVLTQWNPSWVEEDWIAIPNGVRLLKDARNILLTPQARACLSKLVPCTNSALRNCCINLCRKAQVTRISSHDLRRTYISYGEDIGHKRETMLRLTNHAPVDQISSIYSKPELIKRLPVALDVAEKLATLLDEPDGLGNFIFGD